MLSAAEGALRRLNVSGAERNAILDTLRYVDGLEAQRSAAADADARGRDAAAAEAAERQKSAPASTSEKTESKPFTRCRTTASFIYLRLSFLTFGFSRTAVISAAVTNTFPSG